jgi:hypothetical protein
VVAESSIQDCRLPVQIFCMSAVPHRLNNVIMGCYCIESVGHFAEHIYRTKVMSVLQEQESKGMRRTTSSNADYQSHPKLKNNVLALAKPATYFEIWAYMVSPSPASIIGMEKNMTELCYFKRKQSTVSQ